MVNPNSRLKPYISLPPLQQLTALISLSLSRKIASGQGESFSDVSGNDMQLHFLAWFKWHNAGGFPIYLVWAEGWKGREMAVII